VLSRPLPSERSTLRFFLSRFRFYGTFFVFLRALFDERFFVSFLNFLVIIFSRRNPPVFLQVSEAPPPSSLSQNSFLPFLPDPSLQ